MSDYPSVLMIIGSAKQPHSNSEMLSEYLAARLRELGSETETVHLSRFMNNPEDKKLLLLKIFRSDIAVLAAPLFVDSLPALVTEAFEMIAAERKSFSTGKTTHFAAIINCGFPEAHHNDTALAICRHFADAAQFRWLGGLSMGGGEILRGQPLPKNSGMLRNTIKALDHTAHAFADKKPIPEEAVRLMAKPVIPRWMYTTVANYGWKKQSKKFKAEININNQPFKKPSS